MRRVAWIMVKLGPFTAFSTHEGSSSFSNGSLYNKGMMESTKGTMVAQLLLGLSFMIISAFWKFVVTVSLAMKILVIFRMV
jgi:hypothetical protein